MSVSVGVRMYFSMQSEDQRPYVLMSQAGSLAAPLQLLFKSCGRHSGLGPIHLLTEGCAHFRKLFAAERFAVLVRKERAIDWRVLYFEVNLESFYGANFGVCCTQDYLYSFSEWVLFGRCNVDTD